MSTQSATSLHIEDFNQRGAQPTRRFYGEALLAEARRDPRIVCLAADLAAATETDLFRAELPGRFLQAGIAEANMIGVAGGMARSGEIPFVHSFCVFATRRCYDQIAMQAAYPKLPVKIVGVIPGLTTMLGVSHQAIDDIALMRALPNMRVIEPAYPSQMPAAVRDALAYDGPVYMRLKRASAGDAQGPLEREAFDRLHIRREGRDGIIVSSGLMVDQAIAASDLLAESGISAGVVEIATIKPLDPGLVELCRSAPVVLTAENHSITGGLGSAVAEMLMEAGGHPAFSRIGVADTFAEGGSTEYLLSRYGLDAAAIASRFRLRKRSS